MKKIVILVLMILISVSVWYLFVKKYDYQIRFKAKGSPGSIYHQIVNWESWGTASGTASISVLDTIVFKNVAQQVQLKDTILQLNWWLESVNDSVTQIKVGVTSGEHSIANRLGILTGETTFTKSLKKKLTSFGKGVNDFSKTFKIRLEGESEIPSLECLYVSLHSSRIGKAGMMLRANADLYPKIQENKGENGYPFVKITDWDPINDRIEFNFGFPVKNKDSLPINSIIKYTKMPSQKALKATFYALMNYAKRRNISVEKKPLEIFYNDPMQDGNASQWKAEVFLPIK